MCPRDNQILGLRRRLIRVGVALRMVELGGGFGEVGLEVVEVVVGGELDEGEVGGGGGSEDLAGDADD